MRQRANFNAIKSGFSGTTFKTQGDTIPVPYVLHSDQWRASGGYVALTRQSERVMMFAAEQPSAWMMAEGGVSQLDGQQLAGAEKSYAAWADAKPSLAARHDFADYVGYVQAQWQDEKDLRRLDRMARQMGRVEEIRAASQFVQGARPEPASPAPSLVAGGRPEPPAEPVLAAPLPLPLAKQIDARAAALGAARGMAVADPAELAAVQNWPTSTPKRKPPRRAARNSKGPWRKATTSNANYRACKASFPATTARPSGF